MERLDSFTKKMADSGLFRVLDKFQKSLLVFSGVAVFILTVITVFMRYVLKINVLGLDELMLIIIFWMYFIGAAQGSKEDSQIKADMISTVVKNQVVVAMCHLAARFIECAVVCVCLKWSVDYIIKDLSVMPYTVVLAIPLIISHIAMLVGFALMLVYHIYWLLTQIVLVNKVCKGGKTA